MRKIILLLTILLFSSNGIAQDSIRPTYTIEDCDCGIEGLYLTTQKLGSEYSLSCRFTPVNDKDSYLSYITMGITSYNDYEDVLSYIDTAKNHYYDDEKSRAENNDLVIVEDVVTDQEYSIITRSQDPSSIQGGGKQHNYRIERKLIYGASSIISISGRWPIEGEAPSDGQMLSIVNALEACAKDAYDRQDNSTTEIKSRLTFEDKPVKHAPIYLKDKEGEKTFTDENGQFTLDVSNPDNFEFIMDMQYEKEGHTYFILHSAKENVSYKYHFIVNHGKISKIKIDSGSGVYQFDDINYDLIQEMKLENILNIKQGVANIIVNYIHVTEAIDFYTQELNVDFKDKTLEVDLGKGSSAGYSYKENRNYIWMEPSLVNYYHKFRPFTTYHEFTHYVHHILTGETFENYVNDGNINHGGYANPTTGDSYAEGVAAFMSVVIANHYGRWWDDEINNSVSNYPLAGSLDSNWKAWEKNGYAEEIAIAQILWDLIDGPEEMESETKTMNAFFDYANYKFNYELHDFDKDKALNKQEFWHFQICDTFEKGENEYFDSTEMKDIADQLATNNNSEILLQNLKNYSKEHQGYLNQNELFSFIFDNIDYIEKVGREKIDSYDDLPDLVTIEMLTEHLLGMDDDDTIDLTFQDVWNILKKPHDDFTSVYEDLIKAYPSLKEGVDAIFVNHGFFVESSQGNGVWERGDPFLDIDNNGDWTNTSELVELYADLGEMQYNVGEKIGTASNAGRESRRSFAPFTGEYVKVNDNIPFYEVEYIISDYEFYGLKLPSRYYKIGVNTQNGLIYVPMPHDAEVTIRAEGVETVNPLEFSSYDFEKIYNVTIENGYFVEHEFEVIGNIPDFPVDIFDTSSASSQISDNQTAGFELALLIVTLLFIIFYIKIKKD